MRKMSDISVARKFINLHTSAMDRKLEFNLTIADVRRLWNTTKCFYTGIEMNYVEGNPKQMTIDRLDNDKGYVQGNVVACCQRINALKANMTLEDLSFIVKGLKRKKICLP